eukprot:jgi/Chlat1/8356/Chrsp80S00636
MVSEAAQRKAAAKRSAAARKHGGQASSAAANAHTQARTISTTDSAASPSDDSPIARITLPPTLSARQRALLHELAEAHGLRHQSQGDEGSRQITLWRDNVTDGTHWEIDSSGEFFANEDLAAAMCKFLQQDVRAKLLNALNASKPQAPAASTKQHYAKPQHHTALSLDDFVAQTLPLIDLEKSAEMDAAASAIANASVQSTLKRGRTLLNLKCTDVQSGLFGKTVLVLEPNRGELLPPHKFTVHDVVALRANKAEASSPPLGQGVVYRLKDSAITIAVEDVPEEGLDAPLKLEKLANDVTYRILKDTLADLKRSQDKGPAADLIDVLFGSRSPTSHPQSATFAPINRDLDQSQISAVRCALAAKEAALIHGPPGTGKTTAVVEVILQAVKRGNKILACAASNVAVDNLVERLARHKCALVRVGHPARLLPSVLDSCLDAQVLRADNSALARDIRTDIKERQRQAQAVVDVMKAADVVLTTLTGACSRHLQGLQFDLVVIDEAAQALECACWSALLKGRRCVLAGDHLQLPPTVQSTEAERKGLGRTLFERIMAKHSGASAMLTVQYRMHSDIMRWSSAALYDGLVTAHAKVASHRLCDVEGVKKADVTEHPLLLIDTAGCEMEEGREEDGDSYFNAGEAALVIKHALALVSCGVSALNIGVITPYNGQVGALRELRMQHKQLAALEVSSVDGFQGREKQAIIISMVRSNERGEVGFLKDQRRMNVAVTRAQRHCAVICNSDTVGNDPFLKGMVEYFEQHGQYVSAAELTS